MIKKGQWEFRILATEYKYEDKIETWFAIHEVYNVDGDIGATKKSVDVSGNTKKEVKWRLRQMKKCLYKPILWGDVRFPQEYKK